MTVDLLVLLIFGVRQLHRDVNLFHVQVDDVLLLLEHMIVDLDAHLNVGVKAGAFLLPVLFLVGLGMMPSVQLGLLAARLVVCALVRSPVILLR